MSRTGPAPAPGLSMLVVIEALASASRCSLGAGGGVGSALACHGLLAAPQAGIGEVVDALTDEGQPEHGQHDRRTGVDTGPPDARGDVGDGLVQVVAPLGGGGRLDAEAEEAEAGQGQDRLGRVQREDQRQRAGRVPKTCRNMMRMLEAPITLADSTNGSALIRTVSARMTRKYCGTNTTVIEMAAGKNAAPEARLAVADDDRHHDGQQQRREGVDRVGDHHEHPVEPAAEVAADEAEGDAEEDRQRDGDDDHDGGRLGTPDHPGETS